MPPGPATREWAVSVFVVFESRVLLHPHRRLGIWLPPGGHVDPGELPDDAAVREVMEEAGVAVELVGERAVSAPGPRQLIRPRGVQLELIAPGHEHIDLVYLARPVTPYSGALAGTENGFGWFSSEEAAALELTPELREWVELALAEVA